MGSHVVQHFPTFSHVFSQMFQMFMICDQLADVSAIRGAKETLLSPSSTAWLPGRTVDVNRNCHRWEKSPDSMVETC